MDSFLRFCGWLVLLAFGLPSVAGTGLHCFLPKSHETVSGTSWDTCRCCTCGKPVESEEPQHANQHTQGLITAKDVDHSDDCFVCRYFTGQTPACGLFATFCGSLSLVSPMVATPAILCFVAVFFSHSVRGPPLTLLDELAC